MLMIAKTASTFGAETILDAADRAGRAIPPLWPLASSVAVNPFLGQTGERLEVAAARLRRVAGTRTTMPRKWYASRIDAGDIKDADLASALDAAPQGAGPESLAALKQAARVEMPEPIALPTLADLAAEASVIGRRAISIRARRCGRCRARAAPIRAGGRARPTT